MNIPEILNQIRTKRVRYGEGTEFTIPLKWQKSRIKEGRAVAYINEDQARLLMAASGKDHTNSRHLQLGMTIPNPGDYLGIGKHFLTMLHRGDDKYMVQLDRYDQHSPMQFPGSFDLTSRLQPPEPPDTRPAEMTPEDYYL